MKMIMFLSLIWLASCGKSGDSALDDECSNGAKTESCRSLEVVFSDLSISNITTEKITLEAGKTKKITFQIKNNGPKTAENLSIFNEQGITNLVSSCSSLSSGNSCLVEIDLYHEKVARGTRSFRIKDSNNINDTFFFDYEVVPTELTRINKTITIDTDFRNKTISIVEMADKYNNVVAVKKEIFLSSRKVTDGIGIIDSSSSDTVDLFSNDNCTVLISRTKDSFRKNIISGITNLFIKLNNKEDCYSINNSFDLDFTAPQINNDSLNLIGGLSVTEESYLSKEYPKINFNLEDDIDKILLFSDSLCSLPGNGIAISNFSESFDTKLLDPNETSNFSIYGKAIDIKGNITNECRLISNIKIDSTGPSSLNVLLINEIGGELTFPTGEKKPYGLKLIKTQDTSSISLFKSNNCSGAGLAGLENITTEIDIFNLDNVPNFIEQEGSFPLSAQSVDALGNKSDCVFIVNYIYDNSIPNPLRADFVKQDGSLNKREKEFVNFKFIKFLPPENLSEIIIYKEDPSCKDENAIYNINREVSLITPIVDLSSYIVGDITRDLLDLKFIPLYAKIKDLSGNERSCHQLGNLNNSDNLSMILDNEIPFIKSDLVDGNIGEVKSIPKIIPKTFIGDKLDFRFVFTLLSNEEDQDPLNYISEIKLSLENEICEEGEVFSGSFSEKFIGKKIKIYLDLVDEAGNFSQCNHVMNFIHNEGNPLASDNPLVDEEGNGIPALVIDTRKDEDLALSFSNLNENVKQINFYYNNQCLNSPEEIVSYNQDDQFSVILNSLPKINGSKTTTDIYYNLEDFFGNKGDCLLAATYTFNGDNFNISSLNNFKIVVQNESKVINPFGDEAKDLKGVYFSSINAKLKASDGDNEIVSIKYSNDNCTTFNISQPDSFIDILESADISAILIDKDGFESQCQLLARVVIDNTQPSIIPIISNDEIEEQNSSVRMNIINPHSIIPNEISYSKNLLKKIIIFTDDNCSFPVNEVSYSVNNDFSYVDKSKVLNATLNRENNYSLILENRDNIQSDCIPNIISSFKDTLLGKGVISNTSELNELDNIFYTNENSFSLIGNLIIDNGFTGQNNIPDKISYKLYNNDETCSNDLKLISSGTKDGVYVQNGGDLLLQIGDIGSITYIKNSVNELFMNVEDDNGNTRCDSIITIVHDNIQPDPLQASHLNETGNSLIELVDVTYPDGRFISDFNLSINEESSSDSGCNSPTFFRTVLGNSGTILQSISINATNRDNRKLYLWGKITDLAGNSSECSLLASYLHDNIAPELIDENFTLSSNPEFNKLTQEKNAKITVTTGNDVFSKIYLDQNCSISLLDEEIITGDYDVLFDDNYNHSIFVKLNDSVGNFSECYNTNKIFLRNNPYVFAGTDSIDGKELFVTNGTPGSTRVVKNINTNSGISSNPSGFLRTNKGITYFTADDGVHGRELWESDGTTNGTNLVIDLGVNVGSDPDNLSYDGEYLYLQGRTDSFGNEMHIIKRIETSPGIFVNDITSFNQSPGDSDARAHSNINNGIIYYTANNGDGNNEIYTLLTESAYNRLLRPFMANEGSITSPIAKDTFYYGLKEDVITGSIPSNPDNFLTLSNGETILKAQARPDHNGYELFVIRFEFGQLVRIDFNPAGKGSNPSKFIQIPRSPSRALFSAEVNRTTESPPDRELYRTTGNSPVLLKNINEKQDESSNPDNFVVYNERIYFSANDGIHGNEIWVTDGNELGEGTNLFMDLNPGLDGSNFKKGIVNNGKLYFTATTKTNLTKIWMTDGTIGGTRILTDIPLENGTPIITDSYDKFLIIQDENNGNIKYIYNLLENTLSELNSLVQ
jgi:ELWxxDGT repeat protein